MECHKGLGYGSIGKNICFGSLETPSPQTGVPLGRQYIALAEATGAKWENVAWNYHPPWTVHQYLG